MAVGLASQAAPENEVAVLDVSSFEDDSFFGSLGKFIAWLPQGFAGRVWLWAANEECAAPLQSWFGQEEVALSLEQALETLAQRRSAGGFLKRYASGAQHLHQWTARGYLETYQDEDGERLISLSFRTHIIERVKQNGDRIEKWRTLWPFPDGLQHENEACRRQARLVLEGGQIREADFSPAQTEQALPTNWLDLISDLQDLEELRLLGTGVSDQEVLAALSRFPKLQRLRLDNTDITEVSEWKNSQQRSGPTSE